MIHSLKIWSKYFNAVISGEKTFEVRKNDRGFLVGDLLLLREYDPTAKTFSGKTIGKKVTYILPLSNQLCGGCGEDSTQYVIMAINKPSADEQATINSCISKEELP